MKSNINGNKDTSIKKKALSRLQDQLGIAEDERKVLDDGNGSIPSILKESGLLEVSLAEPTPELLEAALKQLEIQYRCNCDVGEVWEFKRKGEAHFKEWSETQLIQLKLNIITEGFNYLRRGSKGETLVPLKFTREQYFDCVAVMMERKKVYPFREYLKQCEVDITTLIELDTWLLDTLKVDDTPLNRWASKLIFLSVVQRVFEPGCEQRVTPFLIGKPGIGKSVTVGKLLPPEFRQYFSDNFNFSHNHKEKVEQTSDHLLIEIGELGGFSRADRNELKAYLTRKEDKVRFAYARKLSKLPRKFALIGTANPDSVGIIKDDGLLDRILVLECKAEKYCGMGNFLGENREHLWALAYQEYIEIGTRVHDIPGELKSAQFESSKSMVFQDETMNAALDNMSKDYSKDELEAGFTLNQIADMLKFNKVDSQGNRLTLPKSDQMRLTDALKFNNWKREHKENANLWSKGDR